MPMSTFIINNIFFSSCSHTPPSDYGVADIIGNIGQYILIYSLGTFADAGLNRKPQHSDGLLTNRSANSCIGPAVFQLLYNHQQTSKY